MDYPMYLTVTGEVSCCN